MWKPVWYWGTYFMTPPDLYHFQKRRLIEYCYCSSFTKDRTFRVLCFFWEETPISFYQSGNQCGSWYIYIYCLGRMQKNKSKNPKRLRAAMTVVLGSAHMIDTMHIHLNTKFCVYIYRSICIYIYIYIYICTHNKTYSHTLICTLTHLRSQE